MIVPQQRFRFFNNQGLEIRARPIETGDAPTLIELFEHLSSDTRYARFHQTADDPNPQRLREAAEQLSLIDPQRDAALIAFADLPGEPDEPIAVVRFTSVAPGTAELAIVVRDELQRTGIGSRLIALLIDTAKRMELHTLVASVQRENVGAHQLLKYIHHPITRRPAGSMVEFHVHLDGQVPADSNRWHG